MNTGINDATSSIGNIDTSRFDIFSQSTCKIKKSPISPRESTCLSWIAVGKTADEIAEILKISKHTVHFHTKNVIKKLDTANKTHAVTKALVMGYISISRDIV
jgi:DNA-binding CsgD family transcriptional regulator